MDHEENMNIPQWPSIKNIYKKELIEIFLYSSGQTNCGIDSRTLSSKVSINETAPKYR